MTESELKVGITVLHTKHQTKYRLVESSCRMKDSQKGWIDCVLYQPLYENDYKVFAREKESFLEEFEVVSDIPEYDTTPRCFQCGHVLCWDNSECAQDIDPSIEDEDRTYNFYHCPHCGAAYDMLDCEEEERANYDFYKDR